MLESGHRNGRAHQTRYRSSRLSARVVLSERGVTMRYFPQRARKTLDLASLLQICPQCLGDLVSRSDFAGDYYCCLQCNVRTVASSRIGRLPELPPDYALAPGPDALHGAEAYTREMLTG